MASKWYLANREAVLAKLAAQRAVRVAAGLTAVPWTTADRARKRRYEIANAERIAARTRAYRAAHREQSEAVRQAYLKANPQVRRAARNAHRAKLVGAPGNASADQVQARIDVFGGCCWICKAPYEEIDHLIPLSRGGSNWPANLRPICKSCNRRKWLFTPGEVVRRPWTGRRN